MAVVKMGQIKVTPGKAIAYITRPDATADGLWVSTNAAVIDPADHAAIAAAFDRTVRDKGVSKPREGAVAAHHVIQSFAPGEVTAEEAHRIGVQLAELVTGGAHEYVIATHLDKEHVHNHIIFNAVSFQTGKRFRCTKSTIGNIRELSDALCRDAGLSVLPSEQTRWTGRSMADIYRVVKGESAKELLRVEIDKAAMRARSWDEFEAILRRAGIETARRGGVTGTLSFREESMGRAVRDWRLGEAYTEEAIAARITRTAVNQINVDESLVVRETKETITVSVPGTRRTLELTVSKQQLVRHGRTLRVYVPAEAEHRLASPSGQLARTVKTSELYGWFSTPDVASARVGAGARGIDLGVLGGQWSRQMDTVRSLQDRVNATTRWTRFGDDRTPQDGLNRARAELARTKIAYQTRVVAAAELMASEHGDVREIARLMAELRLTELHIGQLSRDVRALTERIEEIRTSEQVSAPVMEGRPDSPSPSADGAREGAAPTVTDAGDPPSAHGEPRSLEQRIEIEVERLRSAKDEHDEATQRRGEKKWNL